MPPRSTHLHQDDTHRLIPTRYTKEGKSVLARIAENESHLRDLFEIDGATNERLLGEANRLPGITVHELVFGVPNFHIINASFTHANPTGSRFSGPERGAWYAGFAVETSLKEVAFHYAEGLREVGWKELETVDYREYLADFRAQFHDLRGTRKYAACLDPDSYVASQRLARELLNLGSAGVVYPSVRHRGGTCLACFRPALVTNVRQARLCTFTFQDAWAQPEISVTEG
ncbi:MAG TPA: RES family NAD+ phosphorylase [Terriglobales bacterium]|nr:RES family NAD+ phosphorylase [Terriglobales bacterium]